MDRVKKKISEELEQLKKLEKGLIASLRNVPDGDLRVSYSHGKAQYYIREEGKQGRGNYVKKKEQNVAKQCAQRDYDRVLQKKVTNRIRQLESILNVCSKEELLQVYADLPPARKQLVEPRILTDEM